MFLRYFDSQELYAFDCPIREVLEYTVQSGGEEFWPKMNPFKAQLALFSVHVMETIETAPDQARILTFKKRGLEALKGPLPAAAVHEKLNPECLNQQSELAPVESTRLRAIGNYRVGIASFRPSTPNLSITLRGIHFAGYSSAFEA